MRNLTYEELKAENVKNVHKITSLQKVNKKKRSGIDHVQLLKLDFQTISVKFKNEPLIP